ncbi:unnamed protein product [Effrenium voratum]|uniref:Tyrosine-protein kinase ephrin type A/B receptor-like domain-containing protein n=1 Tax=Effrenium voratum TaxID=2562239 RepID=A0AA36J5U0_9DINO|nr:unnamed protein product [Effrenium voratum]
MMLVLFWSLLWAGAPFARAACLSSFVPEADRKNIVYNGGTVPVGFGSANWESAQLFTQILGILTSERVGYNVTLDSSAGGSLETYSSAATRADLHFVNEIWSNLDPQIQAWQAANPNAPLMPLRDLDYVGREGMHIFPKSFQVFYEATGVSLQFYKYFNASTWTPSSEFDRIGAFDLTKLSNCNDPAAGDAVEQDYYLQATGDTGAFETVGGVRDWICHQQKWWLSPACRAAPGNCVPLLTHKFWDWNAMRQKAAFYNMPIAMASVIDNAQYRQWPNDHKVLVYSWTPDLSFLPQGVIAEVFPEHQPVEWGTGRKVTEGGTTPLRSYMKPGMDTLAANVVLLLQNVRLSDADIMELLKDVIQERQSGTPESDVIYKVSCAWAVANEARWTEWIPKSTACNRALGFGMVTEEGVFVEDRSGADTCALCPPGKFAQELEDNQGKTSICVTCANGTAQDQGGQTSCFRCDPGTFRVPSGVRCGQCPKGQYQPEAAEDGCLTCTSPLTTATVGAVSQDLCICPVDTYRPCWDVDAENGTTLRSQCTCPTSFYLPASQASRCVACANAMYCSEGSDEKFLPCNDAEVSNSTMNPYPKPNEGYMVILEEPLSVYKCMNNASCPGGFAENCGSGLKGVACGACEAGFYKASGQCEPCGEMEKHPLFLILPMLFSPIPVFILYKVSQSDVQVWGRTQQGFGGVGYLLLVYAQTISVILAVFPSVPVDIANGMGWTASSAEITSLFRLECAGPSDFVGSFILNLVLPQIAGAAFFATWLLARISRIPKLRMDGDVVLGTYGGILKTFFVTVASKCFSLFTCYVHPNGMQSMRSSPEVLQGSDIWSSMVVFAVFAILVNCVGLLALLSWAMWVAPRKFHLQSFRMRWKFMFMKMRPSVHWWMLVILFKGLWIALTSVLFVTTMLQSLWVCFGLLFYTTFSYIYLPWRSVFVAMLDIATHISTLLLCLLLPFLVDFAPEEQDTAVMIFVGLAAAGFLSIVVTVTWTLANGLSPCCKARRERKIAHYAERMSKIYSKATEPRILSHMMTEIPALDILELQYVADMMSAEILGTQIPGRLNWGEEPPAQPVADSFTHASSRSQVVWT